MPFFSIGVTAFGRPALLRETLESILRQTFEDFEIVVGNDDPRNPVSTEVLGVDDPRLRIVNHPRNLGELANMNELLRLARGRFFTWLADDDLYTPDMLESVRRAILRFDHPAVTFTSYRLVFETPEPARALPGDSAFRVLPGPEFLRRHFAGQLPACGVTGFFERAALLSAGGIEPVASARIALLAEYLQLVKAASEQAVAHVDAPLLLYRVHDESWGSTTADLDLTAAAGLRLAERSAVVLAPIPGGDRLRLGVLRLVAGHFVMTAARGGPLPLRRIVDHTLELRRILAPRSRRLPVLVRLVWPILRTRLHWKRRRAIVRALRRFGSFVRTVGTGRPSRKASPEDAPK